MKRKKMMSLLLIGFIPFLFGFRFGAEVKYDQAVKFQHDSDGNNIYQRIAAGDVDGDGAIDLIVFRNIDRITAYFPKLTHEVRIYKNKGPSLPIQDMFAKGTHQSGQGDADTDSVQIYKEEAVDGLFYMEPYPTASQINSKARFYSMAVTYTIKNSKKVVDSIYIGRAYMGNYFCNPSQYYYAGKILQLKNPYVYGGGNPFSWWKRVEVDNTNPTVAIEMNGGPGGLSDYNKETYILRTGDGELYATSDGHKVVYQTMAAGDYKGDGTYDLLLAPWRVWPTYQGDTVTIQNMWGRIYKLTPTRYRGYITSDFIWGDALPGGGYGISQFFHMQAVDMDKDGRDDLLLLQGAGSGIPLSWLPSRGNGFANQNSYKGRLNEPTAAISSAWAANLRLRADLQNKPANNLKGYPDLVLTSSCKVYASYYASDKKAQPVPSTATYSEWNTIYDGTEEKVWGDVWMWNLSFNNVIAADVNNDGENEIIVTTGRTSQFWIFKKSTAKYLTMLR
jgi:hypothetical protein